MGTVVTRLRVPTERECERIIYIPFGYDLEVVEGLVRRYGDLWLSGESPILRMDDGMVKSP